MSVPGPGPHCSVHAFLTHLSPPLILWVPRTTGPGGCMCPPCSSPVLPDHSPSLPSEKSVLTFTLLDYIRTPTSKDPRLVPSILKGF